MSLSTGSASCCRVRPSALNSDLFIVKEKFDTLSGRAIVICDLAAKRYVHILEVQVHEKRKMS